MGLKGSHGQQSKSSHRTLPFSLAVAQLQGIPLDFVKIIPHLSEKQGKRLPRSSNISQVSTASLASISKTVPAAPLCKPRPSRAAPKVLLDAPWHCGKIYACQQINLQAHSPERGRIPRKPRGSVQDENSARLRSSTENSPAVWHCAGCVLPLQGTLQHPASCFHCFHSIVGLTPPQLLPRFLALLSQCGSTENIHPGNASHVCANRVQGGESCSSPHNTSVWL